MLSVTCKPSMLSVIVLNVVMLSDVAPCFCSLQSGPYFQLRPVLAPYFPGVPVTKGKSFAVLAGVKVL